MQTAQVTAMGLFPNGTGPPGFPTQPVAVQTEQASLHFLGFLFCRPLSGLYSRDLLLPSF